MPGRYRNIFWLVVIIVGAGMGYRWYCDSDRRMVASVLNISAPPPTLQVIACESPFATDVLTTCWIEIDPREFPLLLKGYSFEEWPITGTIYGFKRLTSVELLEAPDIGG